LSSFSDAEAKQMSALFEGYMPEQEYCDGRGISTRQAQRERAARTGPPFIKIGRDIYYNIDSFRAWLASKEVRPPSADRGRRLAGRRRAA
jgi:hypothetical protein